uniref:Uncharacterized protein n=1 Tax=Arundo donax TaxID=35708 RepID=A0A0A8Y1F5_ARUDO
MFLCSCMHTYFYVSTCNYPPAVVAWCAKCELYIIVIK